MRLTQNQAFFIIEWILYFALCALSIFFIIQGEVFHKFLAQKTDFTQSEENITSRPMIFSRLSDPFGDDYLEAKLGTNYNISYWVYFRSTKKSYEVIAELKVGNNYYKIEDENHDGLLHVSVNPDNRGHGVEKFELDFDPTENTLPLHAKATTHGKRAPG